MVFLSRIMSASRAPLLLHVAFMPVLKISCIQSPSSVPWALYGTVEFEWQASQARFLTYSIASSSRRGGLPRLCHGNPAAFYFFHRLMEHLFTLKWSAAFLIVLPFWLHHMRMQLLSSVETESLGLRSLISRVGFLMMLLNYQEKNYDDLFHLNLSSRCTPFFVCPPFFPPTGFCGVINKIFAVLVIKIYNT